MKTGMEILKEIRRLAVVEGQKDNSGQGYSSGQASGFRVSGDLLEAWLREADTEEMPDWFEKALLKLFPDEMYRFMLGTALWRRVRLNLLGTTQEGKK